MSSNGFQPRITTQADRLLLLNCFNETTRQIDRLIERQNHIVDMLLIHPESSPPYTFPQSSLTSPVSLSTDQYFAPSLFSEL